MIPFGLFTRVILDNGIVRVDFNDVTWVDNGDGTWSYTIPRNVHLSGSYPKTLLVNNTNHNINLVAKEYVNDQVKLTTLVPYPNFTCYFMGDDSEQSLQGRIEVIRAANSVQPGVGYWYGAIYKNADTNQWFFSGNKLLLGTGDSGKTDGFIDLSVVFAPHNIIDVVVGSLNVIVLLDSGEVFGIGDNKSRQLTNSSTSKYDNWVNLGVSDVSKVACHQSNVAVIANGTVKIRGSNSSGQMGVGNTTSYSGWVIPTTLPSGVPIDIIATHFGVIVKVDDKYYFAGNNAGGGSGIPTSSSNNNITNFTEMGKSPVKVFPVATQVTYALMDDGYVYFSGVNLGGTTYKAFQVTNLPQNTITHITPTRRGAIAISNNNRVFITGSSTYIPTNTDSLINWVDITDFIGSSTYAMLFMSGCFTYSNSTLKYIGTNTENVTGQLDIPTYTVPTEIPYQ